MFDTHFRHIPRTIVRALRHVHGGPRLEAFPARLVPVFDTLWREAILK